MKLKGKVYKVLKFNLKLQRMFAKASERFKDGVEDEDMDLLEDLIILAYGNKFTREDLEEEFDMVDLMKTFFDIISEVNNNMENRIEKLKGTIQLRFGNVVK